MNDWLPAVLTYMAGGLRVTLFLALMSVLVATVLGVFAGALLLNKRQILRLLATGYVDLFRGVPSLIMILFAFFSLPELGIRTNPLAAVILGLGVWGSANTAEIFRGALQSISPHQGEAASALGLSPLRTMLWVIAPQALRRFLPPYLGQVTIVIQGTALASIVGVADLQGTGRQMIERLAYSTGDGHAILIYGVVLLVFFAICYPITVLGTRLEQRLVT